MTEGGNRLLFGRYNREECGLPPLRDRRAERRGVLLRALFILVVLVAAGWLAGIYANRWREAWMQSLPALVAVAGPAETAELLGRGRLYAAALPGTRRLRDHLAFAVLVAAERAPRRMGYYGNLANIYGERTTSLPDNPLVAFASELSASGVYADLGRYRQAFASLARADAALSAYPDEAVKRAHRLLLVNAQAYYLAVAPIRDGGNPEKALHLAQLLLSSRDELVGGGRASAQAPFLDTLASAWFATGDAEKALETQRLALGLAGQNGLEVYIKTYDTFNLASQVNER